MTLVRRLLSLMLVLALVGGAGWSMPGMAASQAGAVAAPAMSVNADTGCPDCDAMDEMSMSMAACAKACMLMPGLLPGSVAAGTFRHATEIGQPTRMPGGIRLDPEPYPPRSI
ncbi:hypothetical protein [Indioceanicola profundi]|uniref:hypothetical protein n=1 Tax=Indioceanicola profundi TaxID=2220096 RepID=UPI000E6AD82A|nr:hypothetical protein [Indioceanicola profundi]